MHRDIFGAREAGPEDRDVRFRSGHKAYLDCVPDYTTDLRDLMNILGMQPELTQAQLRGRGTEDLGPQF